MKCLLTHKTLETLPNRYWNRDRGTEVQTEPWATCIFAPLVLTALKVMGVREHPTLRAMVEETVPRQAKKIIADPSHIFYSE